MDSQYFIITIPPVFFSIVTSFDDQKRFKRFILCGQPEFSGDMGEDADVFHRFLSEFS